MPFLAIGSSGLSSAKTATSSEVVDKLEALGIDQPLAEIYGKRAPNTDGSGERILCQL